MTILPTAALTTATGAGSSAARRQHRRRRIPHIVLYCLGNYTHPTTRHSLAQYLIPSLFEELLDIKVPRDSKGKELVRMGSEEGLLKLHRKHDAWIGGGMGVVPAAGQGGGVLTGGKQGGNGGGGKKEVASKTVTSDDGGEMHVKLTVVRPRLLMNISGRPLPFILKSLTSTPDAYNTRWTISPSSSSSTNAVYLPPTALVLHDSLSHPACSLSTIKYSTGPQGHNGLRSVEAALKSRAYHRLSLGIGRPPTERFRGDGVSEWVLGELTREEKMWWEGQGVKEVVKEIWALARRLEVEAEAATDAK